MSTSFDFDLFVIGGGSGGVRAARMAAQRGARVALAEVLGDSGLGGTCVNVGCIPKKLYSYAAHYADAAHEAQGYGWEGDMPILNWGTLKANRATEISRLNGVYGNLLRGSGVTVFDGFALGLQAGQKIIVSIKDRKIRHLDRLFGCSWNCGIISRRGC